MNIGRSIIDGMRNGVIQAASGLVNSVANAVQNALNWVRTQLGIHSPSREGMKIGSFFTQGS